MNDEVKQLSSKPKICFKSARKLSNHLLRTKAYPTERSVGSFKDTHREKSPSNKIPALTKSMNMDMGTPVFFKKVFVPQRIVSKLSIENNQNFH